MKCIILNLVSYVKMIMNQIKNLPKKVEYFKYCFKSYSIYLFSSLF